MTKSIPVVMEYENKQIRGRLIDFGTQSIDGSLSPVGIVLTESGTIKSVPLELIKEVNYL